MLFDARKLKLPSFDFMVVCKYACDCIVFTLNLSLLYINISSNSSAGMIVFAFGFELSPRISVLIKLTMDCKRFLGSIVADILNGPFLMVVVSLLLGCLISIVIVRVGEVMVSFLDFFLNATGNTNFCVLFFELVLYIFLYYLLFLCFFDG